MSFPRAAHAALAGQPCRRWRLARVTGVVVIIVTLAGFSLSCGSSSSGNSTAPNHNAYVTLPSLGSVALLYINGATGAVSLGAKTPTIENFSPFGLALLKSKKLLYVVNAHADTIETFNIAPDGTLTPSSASPTQAGNGPYAAVIDPTGQYLLVTNTAGSNNDGGDVSVYAIDSTTGALTEVSGSPFRANSSPTEILITPSGKFVFVSNPDIGMVTAFLFCPPQSSQPQCSGVQNVLTQVAGSPVFSGLGASGLAVDASEQYLYVANSSASNLPLQSNIGNISGFNIDQNTGGLSPITGSPFTAAVGNNPSALTVDPSGKFLYAVTPGSSFSIWCFTITSTSGQLVSVQGSPFSQTAGGLFALIDPTGNYLYIGGSNGVAGLTYNSFSGAPAAIANSPFPTGVPPGKMVLFE